MNKKPCNKKEVNLYQ